MTGWPLRELRSCLSAPLDYGANASAIPFEARLPRYIRITDVGSDGALNGCDPVSIAEADAKGSMLDQGDLLFARSGATVGKTYLHEQIAGKWAFAGYMIRAKANQAVLLPKFLHWYTRGSTYQKWVASTARAGAQPNISAKEYGRLLVPVPPVGVQSRICSLLTSWEDAHRAVTLLIAAKRRFKRGLMQELLIGKRRFKGFEQEPWREHTIGDLFRVIARPVDWDDDRVYDLLSIRRRSGGVFHRARKRGGEIKTKRLFMVQPGDFLISKMQVVHGALGLVRQRHADMYVSGSYVVLENTQPDVVRTEFFDLLTRLPQMYHLALLASYGVHIEKMTFNLKWYMRSRVSIPSSLKEQELVIRTVGGLESEERLLRKLRAALDRQRRGVAELLLTGQIRIPE